MDSQDDSGQTFIGVRDSNVQRGRIYRRVEGTSVSTDKAITTLFGLVVNINITIIESWVRFPEKSFAFLKLLGLPRLGTRLDLEKSSAKRLTYIIRSKFFFQKDTSTLGGQLYSSYARPLLGILE